MANLPQEDFDPTSMLNGGIATNRATLFDHNPGTAVAVNASATLTAAQVASGYITCTSTAAVTMTMPTGTLLGAALNATQGLMFDLIIDNTASTGSGVVTLAVGTNGILSDMATVTAASAGQVAVNPAALGMARFTLLFTSATAYTITRTA